MSSVVKVGIIGIGFMGSTHFRIYQGLEKAKITAIADIDPKKISGDWSQIIGNIGDGDNNQPIDLEGINAYENALDLINDPTVDLVDICLPTYLHKEFILAALKAGKHVLSEKPIALNSEEVERILNEAKKTDSFFTTGMCVRYWPEYQHAYETYSSGKLGSVKSATFKRYSGNIDGNAWQNWFMNPKLSGGAILDLHIHDVDIVRYFFGRPRKVTAFALENHRSKHGIDQVMARFDYEDGSLITAEGGWSAATQVPFEMSFQIICEKGTIHLSSVGYKIYYEDGNVEEPQVANPALPTGWHVEIDYVLSCILNGSKPEKIIKLEEMKDAVSIVEAENISINEARAVVINY